MSLRKALAKILHHNYSGLTDQDYLFIIGEERREYDELEQHEKQDLEFMAEKVIKYLDENGLLGETKDS